ncbi:unnamed protein product [Caretta caretta]
MQCKYIAVAKMVCGDITVTRIYAMVLMFVINRFDLMLIALSYGLIIRAVLRISSKKAYQKALNTCTAHICVMLTYYTPGLFSSLTHQFSQGIVPHVYIILADLYLLIPPVLNPIVYGVKTKELRDKWKEGTDKGYMQQRKISCEEFAPMKEMIALVTADMYEDQQKHSTSKEDSKDEMLPFRV